MLISVLKVLTMIVLFVASIVGWARLGNEQLRSNWDTGRRMASTGIARQIFNGACVGVLGLTGFECKAFSIVPLIVLFVAIGIPSYASNIKPGRFPQVLRNLHYPAILINTLSMLFVLAIVPLETTLTGANVLSILAEIVSSHRRQHTFMRLTLSRLQAGGFGFL